MKSILKCIVLTLGWSALYCTYNPSSSGIEHMTHEYSVWATPSNSLSGNRFISGNFSFTGSLLDTISFTSTIKWITSLRNNDQSIAVISCENGERFLISVENDSISVTKKSGLFIPSPLLVTIEDNRVKIISYGSLLSFPLEIKGVTYYVEDNNLESTLIPLSIPVIPDGRMVVSKENNFAVLANPTTRYTHGVLGDGIEAEGLYIHARDSIIGLPSPYVAEGISPMFADVDNDDEEELIVTLSHETDGGKLAVYKQSGKLLAVSDGIGQGYRWRHQLMAAQFYPQGPVEIAVIKTPHIGGVLEFFQLHNDRLEIAESKKGYSTHTLGSRNLDMAVAIDVDNDTFPEIILPSQDFLKLHIVKRMSTGVDDRIVLPLPAALSSNLSVSCDSSSFYLFVGSENILSIYR